MPQIVVNVIRITASPTPALGRGTSSTRMLLAEWKTVAFIGSIVDPPVLNRIKFEFQLALLGNGERQLILGAGNIASSHLLVVLPRRAWEGMRLRR